LETEFEETIASQNYLFLLPKVMSSLLPYVLPASVPSPGPEASWTVIIILSPATLNSQGLHSHCLHNQSIFFG
jgi:hypothetical protein